MNSHPYQYITLPPRSKRVAVTLLHTHSIVMSRQIHIGREIRRRLEASDISKKDFAEALCCERNSLYYIFEQPSIDIHRLLKISKILRFDFLSLYREAEGSTSSAPARHLGMVPLHGEDISDFLAAHPDATIIDL